MFNWNDLYIGYLNLDHRKDRLDHMKEELKRVGIVAERTRGKLPTEYDLSDSKLQVMNTRTKGAIACHYGQVEIMQKGLDENKSVMVLEDDVVFCDDLKERLNIIQDFLSENNWDIFWLGGTHHKEPTWHKSINGVHSHSDLKMCDCNLNRDWEETDNPYIVRTFGIWSTYAYIVNKNSIEKILRLLEENVHLSMGIDWLMILLQPRLNTFCFNPGCVKQIDNQSDIGRGVTVFSNFEKLGNHWFAEKI